MPDRQAQMKHWLDSLGYHDYAIDRASEDASFRSYWRLQQDNESWIVMDAPPEKEPCDAYIKVANRLTDAGLSAPQIIYENHDEGFLIITDFGNESYLKVLNPDTATKLYGDAIAVIEHMQTCLEADDLPPYDETLLRNEMDLFKEWFLQKLLGIELNEKQLSMWKTTVDTLVQNALEQPQAFVHRDYHSRNLMKIEQGNPGILDFQDAVKGPVTYDLVSLLRDCYIDWPQAQVEQWVAEFYNAVAQDHLKGVEVERFMRWFNLMGAQRHLKAIGIFSRLKLRDGKDHYIHDIPRTLNYLQIVGAQEKTMVGLKSLIDELDLAKCIGAKL